MRVIALCQVYNEALFVERAIRWISPLVDHVVIMEGRLTPIPMESQSTDGTREILDSMLGTCEAACTIPNVSWLTGEFEKERNERIVQGRDRETQEGINKNFMLEHCIEQLGLEHGDLIFILDVDEFWHPSNFLRIVERFREDDTITHVPVEEYQFAYNLRQCFDAEHNGRFMRYVNGSRFGNTNHFIYPDGKDITKDYTHLVPREETGMCHLCWCKHPKLVRQKVVSFRRQSFTTWYNYVYLKWPFSANGAYFNNHTIPPYHGRGFAEGQHAPLYEFSGELPEAIKDMEFDWLPYIRTHHEELLIP